MEGVLLLLSVALPSGWPLLRGSTERGSHGRAGDGNVKALSRSLDGKSFGSGPGSATNLCLAHDNFTHHASPREFGIKTKV